MNVSEQILPHQRLTDREYRVMWLLATGRNIAWIAEELRLKPAAVTLYKDRVLKKLGLRSLVDLVGYAMKHRIIV